MFEYYVCWMEEVTVDVNEVTGEPMYFTEWSMREVSRTEAISAIRAGVEVRIKMVKGKTKWHFCHMYNDHLVCDELPF